MRYGRGIGRYIDSCRSVLGILCMCEKYVPQIFPFCQRVGSHVVTLSLSRGRNSPAHAMYSFPNHIVRTNLSLVPGSVQPHSDKLCLGFDMIFLCMRLFCVCMYVSMYVCMHI